MAKNAMLVTTFSSAQLRSHVKSQVDAYEVLVEANFPTRWVYKPLSVADSLGIA